MDDEETPYNAYMSEATDIPLDAQNVAAVKTRKRQLLYGLGVFLVLLVIAVGVAISQSGSRLSLDRFMNDDGSQRDQEVFEETGLSAEHIEHFRTWVYKGSMDFSPGYVWVANGGGLLRYDIDTDKTEIFEGGGEDIIYFDDSIWGVFGDVNEVNSRITRHRISDGMTTSYWVDEHDLGPLQRGEFDVVNGELRLTTGGLATPADPSPRMSVSIYDAQNDTWSTTHSNGARELTVTETDLNQALLQIDPSLREEAEGRIQQYCDVTLSGRLRPAQGDAGGNRGGVAWNDQVLWYGCRAGFIVIDTVASTVKFKGEGDGYPSQIYDVLVLKDGVLFADTDLGLGLVDPESRHWTKVRNHLTGRRPLEYGWWNSAVWIDDQIYFMEVPFADPTSDFAHNLRDASLQRYNTNTKEIVDVTPEPRSRLSEAWRILPYILQPTSDGRSILYRHNSVVYKLTSSDQEQTAFPLDFEGVPTKSALDDSLSYWGYVEKNGTLWYGTGAFLGKVSLEDGSIEKIAPPGPFDDNTKYCLDVTNTHVVLFGGEVDDPALYTYTIADNTWSGNLVEDSPLRQLSCPSEQGVSYDESIFANSLLVETRDVYPGTPSRDWTSHLSLINLLDGSRTELDRNLDVTKYPSQILYDGSSIWIRDGTTRMTRIRNGLHQGAAN